MGISSPSRIGKYDIIEVLGRGGMGVVYKAKDPQLGRLVAIKMTLGVGDNPELVSRFFREAQSTASLQHPNIVTVYELGDCGGNPYLVMEYLEGHSLDAIIASTRSLHVIDQLNIMLDVCRGLDYAHQRKIIHRDIKPANIVVLKDGAVKLVDFGIAHIVGKKLTMPGQVIGSFNYMSPEQINSKPIDTRTDIFSAGIVLYQLVTKALPFAAENTAATLMKIVHEAPPPLAKFLNVYPPELEPVVFRALAKDREERYQTVEDFAVDLRTVREQVRQETVNRHLQDATSLIQANALVKAKEEVFQALKWDPHHSRAGQLMREIQLRTEGRQAISDDTAAPQNASGAQTAASQLGATATKGSSRLHECLQEAQEEAKSRRFASALEILKEAEALDPDAPQVKELVRSITLTRENEKKSQELSAMRTEIKAAIRWEDYTGAIEKAAAALVKFPGDTELLKLKEISEQQRKEVERREHINEELVNAQKLLEQGRDEEVITALSQAVDRFGDDTRLDALLRFVRENAERKRLEKRKNDSLHEARERIANKDYSAAIQILQATRTDLQDKAEIEDLLQHLNDLSRAEQSKTTIASAANRARSLLAARSFAEAIKLLEMTLSEAPDEGLEILLAQARKEAAAHRHKLQNLLESAEKLLAEHKPDEAQKLLEAESSSFSSESNWRSLRDRAEREMEVAQQIERAIAEARGLAQSGQFDAARNRLVECKTQFSGSKQIEEELVRIQQLRIAENGKTLAKAVDEAVRLNASGEYDAALHKLASVSQFLPDVPALLRSQYEDIQKVASDAIIKRARAEIQGYIAAGQLTKAQEMLSLTSTNLTVFKALSDLESAVNDEMKRRVAVRKALDEARSLLQKNEWQKAAEVLRKELAQPIRGVQLKADIIAEFFNAAERSLKANWRSCEQLLKQFRELEPQHQIPASLLTRMSDLRRDEAVLACLDRGKLLQMNGDLQGARREVSQLAAIHPNDPRLAQFCQQIDLQIAQNEEKARQEKARREQEMSVGDAIRRADAETSLDVRASILGQALQKYPNDARLRPHLDHLKDLSHRISEMAQAAKAQEQAEDYDGALAKWEALRLSYRHYPQLEQHIERVKKLRDQARGASRAHWIKKIEDRIAASNYEDASDLLSQATAEFPWDDEFMSLRSTVEASIKARGKADKFFTSADESFGRGKWDAGRKSVIKACQTAKEDRLVWHRAMRQLTEACKSARSEEPSFPESTVRLLSEVGSPFVIPNALLDMLGAGAHARPIQPEVQRKEAQKREEAPVEAKPAGAGWMGKMRQAISALGAADEQISQTASESGRPSRPAAEVAHSSPPALPVRPQMPASESKPSWSPQVSEDKADVPAAKVIQFRSANEGWPRDAQLSATDAFMPGAVAPSLPNFVPAAEPKREPADVPVSSPSVVRGTPDVASAPATVPAKLALRAGTNWPEETLRPIEKRLATIVGPLARVLVNRAAAQANNLDELVSLLVTKLPTEADRTAFLSAKSEFFATAVAQVAADPGNLTLNRTTIGMPESAIDQHSIEHAIQILARYVGPIASVLAKRAAGRARSTEELHLLLAERVEDSKRAQFLKECSIARGN